MRTAWEDQGVKKQVVSPLSLVVTSFAAVDDVRKTKTPQLAVDQGETELLLLDLGKNRLGGSCLAQVYNATGSDAPDVDDPAKLKGLFDAVQKLNRDGLLLAYHDRSDGGLFVAACEMAFATRRGVSLDLDGICYDAGAGDVDGSEKLTNLLAGRDFEHIVRALFNEELGALIQIRRADREKVTPILRACGVPYHFVGTLNEWDEIRVTRNAKRVLREKRVDLQRAWSETSYQMQAMRDNPSCAQQEFDRILDVADPGLTPKLTFDPQDDFTQVYTQVSGRPRVAILREQGVNSHYEMAAAFDKAGFAAVDVHMSDILAGRVSLKDFKGLVACGGFSYGDVLGAGLGWARTILMHDGCRDEFAAFFNRPDTFALGVCNGCQMMSALKSIIPGAEHWPAFRRNKVEQFEARFVMTEILDIAVDLLRRHGRLAGAHRRFARRGQGGLRQRRRSGQGAVGRALRRQQGRADRGLSVQPERLAERPDGSDHGRWSLHDHDAAPGTRLPHRADVLAPGKLGRGFAVAAHVPQRAALGGINTRRTDKGGCGRLCRIQDCAPLTRRCRRQHAGFCSDWMSGPVPAKISRARSSRAISSRDMPAINSNHFWKCFIFLLLVRVNDASCVDFPTTHEDYPITV